MPIYEYKCASCAAALEKIQKFSDAPLVKCPQCGEDALVKLVSAPSFRLKGSGWYETDFKTGKKKNGAGEDSAVSSTSTGDKADTAATPAKSEGASTTGSSSTTSSAANTSSTASTSKAGPA